MRKQSLQSIFILCISLVSMFASAEVTVNKNRVFITNNNTQLKVDNVDVTATEFAQKALGMEAEVLIDEDVNADVTAGTAKEINAENQIKGPVTNVAPLQVLGQDVVIDADTVLANTTGSFAMGDLLKVSGVFTENNVLLAGRIEATTTLVEFKLMAQVSAINGNLLQFGQLNVDTTGVTLEDCGAGIQVGDLVELEATVVTNFDITNPLDTVSDFECKTGVVAIPPGNNSTTLQFSAEGFVSAIIDATHFSLNGQTVEFSTATVFENGTVDDLTVGVKVEAEGSFDATTNLLSAEKIEFRQVRVRITAPVAVADLNSNQATALNISGLFSALTRDQDNLIPALSQDTQLELRGYLDSSGTFRVDKIRDRGVPEVNDIRLRGPVSNVANPAFDILGVNIDITGASLFIESTPVDSATFFASLADGAEVDVNHGIYDAQTNTSMGGEITIEEVAGVGSAQTPQPAQAKTQPGSYFIQANGLGGIGKGRIDKFVVPTGAAPVALVASNDISADEGSSVTLDGSSSTGDTLTFSWVQTSGVAVTLADPNVASTSFTAPQVSADSTLVFELTVTDSIGSTDITMVTVVVKDTTPPAPPPPPTTSGGGGGSVGIWLLLLAGLIRRR